MGSRQFVGAYGVGPYDHSWVALRERVNTCTRDGKWGGLEYLEYLLYLERCVHPFSALFTHQGSDGLASRGAAGEVDLCPPPPPARRQFSAVACKWIKTTLGTMGEGEVEGLGLERGTPGI